MEYKCDEDGWPDELAGNVALWAHLVDGMEQAWERQLTQREVQFAGSESGTLAESVDPNFTVPTANESAWQRYKGHLADKSFPTETIASIEEECLETLRCLKLDNVSHDKDVKGLVIGHVQSGKTANMAGLMAMAADWGFNMFIVLTGTIENLRKQTQDRLYNDLNRPGCTQHWTSLHHLKRGMDTGLNSSSYIFDAYRNYLTISLKNRSRLENLLGWLTESEKHLEQMNILLIDDESDQAGINTKTNEERTAINKCILDLTKLKSRTMNYVAYTATPYANVLNEAGEGTLYPKSFIRSLPMNRSYFGPERIFGASAFNTEDESGGAPTLDIVRDIQAKDLDTVSEIHTGDSPPPPETLRESLAWFLCAAGSRRVWGATDPTSMLIHTSQRVAHHSGMAKVIEQFFNDSNPDELVAYCREVWDAETSRLSREKFGEQYPNYQDDPPDYPEWEQVETEIRSLISENLRHIQLDSEGIVQYSNGIHLCIDNGTNNGTDDEGNFKRLLYPEQAQNNSKAFIVIGGATLSRGLTIEGLVSTFFVRSTRQGDTLMQMGRWFGYRRGYELLPRIWMPSNTQDQFAYLARIEADLREEIQIYKNSGAKPSEFGPKISHWAPALLSITGRNRMQGATTADFDFSGIRNENTIFFNDTETLKSNVESTEEFLGNLEQNPIPHEGRGLLFTGVPFATISQYLRAMRFHPRSKVFSEINKFIDWFDQVADTEDNPPYEDWNVIVPSISGSDSVWQVGEHNLGKVNRSRKSTRNGDDAIDIGSLLNPADKFLDFPEDLRPENQVSESVAAQLREDAGLGSTPQLIIYRINGRGTSENLRNERENLNLDADVIGLVVRVPGKPRRNLVRTITIQIAEGAYPDDSPDIEDAD